MTIINTPLVLSTNYTFISELGEGSNGKTYLATVRRTGQKVAIKSLKLSQINNLKSLDLFKREAETLKSIQISGVPAFYESVIPEHGDGNYYIVQEYVPYRSIKDMLDSGEHFSETEILQIMQEMALILHKLQTFSSRPIIHRDIKPSNILYIGKSVSKDSEMVKDVRNRVYLIDFGAVANPTKRSSSSTIAGTFGYMAPEQIMGDFKIQSDFYSLGATALHMLTGVPPYELSFDGFKVDLDSALFEYAPKTSQKMRELLESLLSPDVINRPESANELSKSIEGILNPNNTNDFDNNRRKRASEIPIDTNLFKGETSVTNTEKWLTVPGKIWAVSAVFGEGGAIYTTYEYTYEVKGKLCVAKWSQAYLSKQVFPCPCTVQYNPSNPHISRIIPD